MRTCPHCQFLVADDASTCSVCHGAVAAPRSAVGSPPPVPVGATAVSAAGTWSPGSTGADFMAPGGASAPPPPPFNGFVPNGVPGQPVPAAAPPARPNRSAALKVVLVLLAVGVLGMAGLVGLSMIGVTTGSGEIVASELDWQVHEDAAGRFRLEMPGETQIDLIELPGGFGEPQELEVAWVRDLRFSASVGLYEGIVPAGSNFEELSFSPTEVVRVAGDTGMEGAEFVGRTIPEEHGGSVMDMEVRGTLDGEAAVMLSRLVIAPGERLIELNVVGPAAARELDAMRQRMSDTLETA
jgi:hypothetical protein